MSADRPLLVTVLVRQLHSKRTFDGDGYGWSVCAECRQAWPCATEKAIADALAVPEQDRSSEDPEPEVDPAHVIRIDVYGNPFDDVYVVECSCGFRSQPLGATRAGIAKNSHLASGRVQVTPQ